MIFVAYRITKPYLHSQLNEIARRNSKYHFSVLFFVRQEFYDAIQLQLKNLQSVSRVLVETDSFACIRRMVELLIPALACKVYVVAPCRFMVCHKGSYEIIPGRFLHFLLYISLLLPIMEE